MLETSWQRCDNVLGDRSQNLPTEITEEAAVKLNKCIPNAKETTKHHADIMLLNIYWSSLENRCLESAVSRILGLVYPPNDRTT